MASANAAENKPIDGMSEYLTVCEDAARAGGAVLLEKYGRVDAREKGPADLVTEADLASQEAVCGVVLDAFPEHRVLGEEDPLLGTAANLATEFRWLVDPLDGTTNYVHGVPHFAVSVALERAGDLLAATVFSPLQNECYTAAPGAGARLNGEPIHVSDVRQLSNALAAVGFPPGVKDGAADLALFLRTVARCQSIRRTGSAALNLCYVAAGRFDLFGSYSTKIWDVAAGVLIVREAGGVVTAPDGGELRLDTGQFLCAATPELHAEMLHLTPKVGT